MEFEIRKANENDVKAIYHFICLLEEELFSEAKINKIFLSNLEQNNIGYFVAEYNGLIVGFASITISNLLHHCGIVGEIQELIIAPDYRGKHIGQGLVKRLIEWAFKRDSIQIEVTCNLARVDAQSFYTSIGFSHTHQKLVLKDCPRDTA